MLAPNTDRSERDLWLCAWFLAPIIGVVVSHLDATIYSWLLPLIFLSLEFVLERFTGIEPRVGWGRNLRTQVKLPRYFASPLAIGGACALGVISSLVFVRGEPVTIRVFLAHSLIVLACLSAPAILFLARTGARRKWNCSVPNEARFAFVLRSLAMLAVFGVAQVPRSCAHERELERNVEFAMNWCDGVVPRLDAWKESHGAFPASLKDLGDDVVPPRLIHGEVHYSSGGSSFMFDVPDPDEFVFPWGWEYYSDTRRWHHYN